MHAPYQPFDAVLSRRIDLWLAREERGHGWRRRFRRAMRHYYERQICV